MDRPLGKESLGARLRKATLRSLNETSDHPGVENPRVELSNTALEEMMNPLTRLNGTSEETPPGKKSRVDRLLRAASQFMKEIPITQDRKTLKGI